MKAILEFNLPDDQDDFQDAVNGQKWKLMVWEFDQDLRSKIKYAPDSISALKFTGVIDNLQVKQESKYLKRPVTFTNGFNYQLGAASWESSFYEWEFVTDIINLDGTEINNKSNSNSTNT